MNKLIIVIIALFMVACTPATTVRYMYKPVTPEDHLILDCQITPPPDKEEYLVATDKQKELLLSNTLATQYKYTKECNVRLKNLREWKVNIKDVVTEDMGK